VSPPYRGVVNAESARMVIVDEFLVPQEQFNKDRLDGTGPSGYVLDKTKMQMVAIQYTWYGAGFIDWGLRATDGQMIWAHRTKNNNVNDEAYMRSGNLPARYETNTLPVRTFLTATLASGSTGPLTVNDTTFFPSTGTLLISAAGDTSSAIEYITYTGKTATTFTGLTRNATGGTGSATTFTYSATAPINIESYSPGQASTVSHWGSSVIMDGRYDDDKSFVFVAGMSRTQTVNNVAQDATVPLLSIRLSPSVDNGLSGVLGQREIINRMQLVLRSMAIQTTGAAAVFLVTLRLNGRVNGGTFQAVGGSSLAQIAYHGTGAGTSIAGGENIFGFYVYTPGVLAEDLFLVRDIGNSILGGGTNNNVPTTVNNIYPDGPDIITVCATNVTAVATNSINTRVSWTEAQA